MDLSLQDGINKFLDHLDLIESKSSHTISNYRRYLQHFLEFTSNISIKSLASPTIQKYRVFLSSKQSGRSLVTQNYHLTALREFIRFANQNSWLELNPKSIALHPLSKKPATLMPEISLTRLQGQPIPPTKEGLRDQLVLELLVSTGLKVSELVTLTGADVFPNFRQINIGHGSKARTLLLPASTSLLLERYLRSRRDNDSSLLAASKSTKHSSALTARTIQRIVKRLSAVLHTQQITPTAIRNQFASNLFTEGMSVSHAGHILGHAHQSSTAHIKSNLSKTD